MCRGVSDEPLQEEGVVAEGAGRDPAGGGQGGFQVLGAFDDVHALPAAAGGGLDQQREPDAGRGLDQLRVRHAGFGDARDHGDAVAGDVVLGADLVAHDVEGFDAGADERDPGLFEGAGEVDVLAQEAVAGVHGLGAGVAAGLDDGLDLEVALGRGGGADPHGDVGLAHVPRAGVGVGIDGDRTDAEGAQGPDDAAGDLAAVGDEHGAEQGVPVVGVAVGVATEGVVGEEMVGEERFMAGSHPEEAEGGLRQRGAGDDVERQSQDGAGVRGVDHAVVPEAGGGVVGAALVLVLLP